MGGRAVRGLPEIEPRVIGDVTRIEDQEEGTQPSPFTVSSGAATPGVRVR